jgi:hypothetical protein
MLIAVSIIWAPSSTAHRYSVYTQGSTIELDDDDHVTNATRGESVFDDDDEGGAVIEMTSTQTKPKESKATIDTTIATTSGADSASSASFPITSPTNSDKEVSHAHFAIGSVEEEEDDKVILHSTKLSIQAGPAFTASQKEIKKTTKEID